MQDPDIELILTDNHNLKLELKRLRRIIDTQTKGAKVFASVVAFLTIGPSLSWAIKEYLDAKDSGENISSDIRASLYAAVLRRIFHVFSVGAVIAIIPIALLFWQNFELKKQSALLARQMEFQQRSELHRVVFGENRQRQEAVQELLSKGSGLRARGEIDLVGANMSSVILEDLDLTNADLRKSIIVNATFNYSRLDGAKLDYISGSFVKFNDASLVGASLTYAQLVGAQFVGADVRNADFRNAVLQAANFTEAHLDGANFEGACYVEEDQIRPIWPLGFDPKKRGIIINDAGCSTIPP